jgi:hypothetical protein
VTVKLVCDVFVCVSVAVQLTVVVVTRNVVPDAGEQRTGTEPPPAAVAVGLVYVTFAPEGPP